MPLIKSSDDYVLFPDGSTTEVARFNSGSMMLTGSLAVAGETRWQEGSGGVWRDLLTALIPPASGVTIPVVTAVGAGGMQMPLWAINDAMYFAWHIPHDYSPGTQVHMHAHWCVDGTNVQPVRWEFMWWFSRGTTATSRGTFAFGSAGTITTATQAANGTAYTHFIAETAAITIPNIEVDGLIQVRLRRITNGGTENTNNVFYNQADLHYQAITPGTVNRVFPFT